MSVQWFAGGRQIGLQSSHSLNKAERLLIVTSGKMERAPQVDTPSQEGSSYPSDHQATCPFSVALDPEPRLGSIIVWNACTAENQSHADLLPYGQFESGSALAWLR